MDIPVGSTPAVKSQQLWAMFWRSNGSLQGFLHLQRQHSCPPCVKKKGDDRLPIVFCKEKTYSFWVEYPNPMTDLWMNGICYLHVPKQNEPFMHYKYNKYNITNGSIMGKATNTQQTRTFLSSGFIRRFFSPSEESMRMWSSHATTPKEKGGVGKKTNQWSETWFP